MFCTKRRVTPYVREVNKQVLSPAELRFSEYYSPSPVDEFLFQEHKSPDDTEPSVRLTSDIYMLFNQQRLDRMTSQALIQHFDAMSQSNQQFSELRARLGDEQLRSFVKSRYIQSPSELMAWSRYIDVEYGAELSALTPPADPQPDVEPQPTE